LKDLLMIEFLTKLKCLKNDKKKKKNT
jgi:hypothetical protein